MDPRQGIADDIDRETKGEQFQNGPLCPAYFQPEDSAIDVASAVTSRIDFDRISAPRSDAEHDAAIPRPLHVFISFPHPAASSARSRGGRYLRRTNMRKHPGNDRRFSPLSLARRVLRGTRFASSLWSFNVCSADSSAIRPLWRPSFGPLALIQYYIIIVDGANFVNATNQLRRHAFKQLCVVSALSGNKRSRHRAISVSRNHSGRNLILPLT